MKPALSEYTVLLGQISVKSKTETKQKTETRTLVNTEIVAYEKLPFFFCCSTGLIISFTALMVSDSTGEIQNVCVFKVPVKTGKKRARSSAPKMLFSH